MLRFYRLSAVAMALTVSLTACTEGDGTGLNDEPFAAEVSAADLQVVQSAFAASVFESLAISSESFILVQDPGPLSGGLLQASLAAASAGSHWEAEAAARAFAAVGSAAGTLIPSNFLGCTYDPAVDGFREIPDCADPDAPENGVRFILYEVDRETHELGGTAIGYVDLLDKSTDLAHVARVVVVTNEVVRINYSVSAVLGTQSLGFTVFGFIGDGTDRIDVDLSITFVHDYPVSIATAEYLISVPSRDFEVDARVVLEFDEQLLHGSVDIEATFMQGHHTVTVTGVITSEDDFLTEGGDFKIHVDGQLFATISLEGDTPTVRNADGGELTAVEREAVHSIFDGLESFFEERFEDFTRPVAWLFGDGVVGSI